jgi:hypothetical protein
MISPPYLVIYWNSYPSPISILVAVILLVIGLGIAFAARRMTKDVKLPKMGKIVGGVVIAIWAFSILTFLKIIADLSRIDPGAASLGSIAPITIAAAFFTAGYVVYILRRFGMKSALGNGFLAFIAGPMTFELPFVFIVIPRVSAPLIPALIFLATLFAIIFTTLSLLLLSRKIALTKYSLYFYGGMILVFAIWAGVDGYSYPDNPVAFALNAISKILGFASVAALFRAAPSTEQVRNQLPAGSTLAQSQENRSAE